ncbi:organoarsenical effux MFS transporter ArsJ [Microbulbifer aestuariivivens]
MPTTMLANLPSALRQYLVVTANYWAFTLTDGALRMLVVLYFHGLGYSPLQIALLFVFYEAFGVVTNLLGGWLGARVGLNRTMNIGLGLQVLALAMLLVPQPLLAVPWVMFAQALSGIAKDLNKMSAKSAIKLLVPGDQPGRLYHWVSLLTGSKNALKGIGFFLGGLLLATMGFEGAIASMAAALSLVWVASLLLLKRDLGRAKVKQKFRDVFSSSRGVNLLAAARVFLFAARDVWFVVALPVYLSSQFDWSHWQVGGFLALWIVGYGIVQSQAPRLTGTAPDGRSAFHWALLLSAIPASMALLLASELPAQLTIIVGLLLFGMLFAVNSGLHSFLIVHFAREDGVSMDVGFYYMANAAGRLAGTVLSGWLFQAYGLSACLWVSALFLVVAAAISLGLPRNESDKQIGPG